MKGKLIRLLIVGAVIAFVGSSVPVQAVGITGDIQFLGVASASGPSGGGATTISFTNPGWKVIGGTDDYAGVPVLTPATFNAITFTGTGLGAALSANVEPQWLLTGTPTTEFDLTSLISAVVVSGSMALNGTGIARMTGFDDTPANWSLQGSTGGGFTFTLSSSTTGAAVPDGGTTVVLLGAALSALGLIKRRLA